MSEKAEHGWLPRTETGRTETAPTDTGPTDTGRTETDRTEMDRIETGKRNVRNAGDHICAYSEEDWVDLLSGAADGGKSAAMMRHLPVCSRCASVHAEWTRLLAPPAGFECIPAGEDHTTAAKGDMVPSAGTMTAGVERWLAGEDVIQPGEDVTAEARQPGANAVPPAPRVYRSLRRRVKRIGLRRRVGAIRPAYRWGAAGLCAALLLVFGLLRMNTAASANQWSRYVAAYEPAALTVLHDPGTVSYPIDAAAFQKGEGRIWYNEQSGEVLVLVNGLPPGQDRVFQAWAVRSGGRDNLGLLHYHLDRAHLYIRPEAWNGAGNIALTVEPNGGSPVPTTPDTVLLRLPKP